VDQGFSGGGSLALAELIDEHGSALAVDFLAVYHTPLWEALELPPRVVLALVEDLQYVNGAFAASVQGGAEFRGWGVDRHMLANLYDLSAAIGWAGSRSPKKAPTHPRPTSKPNGTPITALFPSKLKRP